ncbi:protein XRP2-like protein, partial [Leptotrombidium deliense]
MINGQQFIVQNCQNANVFVFDHISSVTVDDCTDCAFFFGPTKGSIVLRNCIDCRVMCASQQFRTRDCKCLQVFLYSLTTPAIESTYDVKFACFSFFYHDLAEHFKESGLSVFNNSWNQIFDFNAIEGEIHWSLFPSDVRPEDYFPSLTSIEDMETSMDSVVSVVPKTLGSKFDKNDQTCVVIFFSDGNREKRAKAFIKEMEHKSCSLIRTREFSMKEHEAQNVFGTDSYNSVIIRGPVIALEYSGTLAIKACQDVAKSIALETGSTGLVYVSSNPNTALKQVQLLFNPPDN